MQPLTRVLVIGADAADPALIAPWSAAGDLPNIAALKTRGAFARTGTLPGFGAGASWPAFHSGLDPGHQPQFDGLRGFDPADYSEKHDAAAAPALWDAVSKAGGRCFVMNAPFAPPASAINGVWISDWGGHSAAGTGKPLYTTMPGSAAGEILRLVGPEPANPVPCDGNPPKGIADCRAFMHEHRDHIRKKTRIVRHFLAKGGWDYAEAHFCDLQCVARHLWHVHDPAHPDHKPDLAAALGDPVREAMKALDQALGEILAMLDDRTLVLFYASHGIGPHYSGAGLLDRILFNLEHGRKTGRSGRTLGGHLHALMHPGDAPQEIFLHGRAARKYFEVRCSDGAGGVRVNLKGREARGLVEPASYDALLSDLTRTLSAVVNAETGEPLIEDSLPLHALCRGPYAARLPDLALVWNRRAPIRRIRSPVLGTLAQDYLEPHTGAETAQGFFIAAGEAVRSGVLSRAAAPADFAPTLRMVLGLPAAPSDGTPIAALTTARPTLAYSRA